ncbi:unnamed protein product [Adineta steineri]|uniref:Uncharacterized protein n=1 Tax=Adineta steineri TaxID=433720 RepID=A0A819E005_9BILA|nr:unnamed protein product [Adineta steineri]CAF3841860.1 unnamed protein product [Adineta steineri]
MSYPNNELNRNRDPRCRDRSRSEIRRTDSTDTFASSSTINQTLRPEQSTSKTSVVDFLKTLGINSQLIQALINANPPKIEQIQQQQPQQPLINNAQEFASFLSQSYGLDSTINNSILNQPVNRDPRCRQISTLPTPTISTNSNHNTSMEILPRFTQSNHMSLSIDESYKQYLSSINQSLLDNETRKHFQRIALLDNELDKLHHMNNELIKTSEKRSKRRTSTKSKDPLLKENENLQTELIDYIKTLKTTMMINYPIYMFSNSTINQRQ